MVDKIVAMFVHWSEKRRPGVRDDQRQSANKTGVHAVQNMARETATATTTMLLHTREPNFDDDDDDDDGRLISCFIMMIDRVMSVFLSMNSSKTCVISFSN